MSDESFVIQDTVSLLISIIKKEGPILFSAIPDRLSIDYKQYANGKGLKAWLTGFPEFEASEDGRYLTLSGVHEQITPSIAEVRCMHAFAHMNYWSQNMKQLKQLGDFSNIRPDNLRDYIAHVLMRDLLLGKLVPDTTEGHTFVLNTGLTLSDGNPVSAVLAPNPAYDDGAKPFWLMKGFCSNSPSDTSELGIWLKTHFGDPSTFDYTDLADQIGVISDLQTSVTQAVTAFTASVAAQACPELEEQTRLSALIARYEAEWSTLLTILKSFPFIPTDTPLTLSGLREYINQESFRANILVQALDAFRDMAEGMRKFFDENRWEAGDDCTPMQDHARLVKQYGGSSPDSDLTAFREALDIYRTFLSVVSTDDPDDNYYDAVNRVIGHFPELPQKLRIAALILCDIPREERVFLESIDYIEQLLRQYSVSTPAQSEQETVALPENAQLLRLALEGSEDYLTAWPLYLAACLPEDPQLRQLVVPEDIDCQVPLTCFAAASRLLEADCTAEAERYLILGLTHELDNCAPMLLTLYREAGRMDDFAALWTRHSEAVTYSPLDEAFWFAALCRMDPQQALEQSRSNIHLQYQTAYLSSLITAAEALEQSDLAATLRSRLERFSAEAPNAFEQAVIEDNRSVIGEMALSEQLSALGYTEKQIQRIRTVAEAGEYPAGQDTYQTGRRLYALQHNHNARAEQWMWQGISKQTRGSYVDLMLLLTSEKRWQEAIRLFESNAETQRKFEDCRRLYLICRFYDSPEDSLNTFRENLRDVLTILHLMPSFRENLRQAAEVSDDEFYPLLLKLYEAVSQPYLWSVVTEDRSLRDHVHDRTHLEPLGLDVTTVSEAYRTGTYPHGRDATSVAHRLYALAKNTASAAELAARAAGTAPTAQRLLWNIYSEAKNESALYELLTENETLQREHYEQYLGFLYARKVFPTFLTLLEQSGDLTDVQLLQRCTAEMSLGREVTADPQSCADAAAVCSADTCLELLEAAVFTQNTELITQVLCGCFDTWLVSFPDRLYELVTCGGNGTPELYEAVQNAAISAEKQALAVYFQNILHIGNIPQVAQELYDDFQNRLETADTQDQLLCLHKLRHLYPHRAEAISVQAAVVSVQALLQPDSQTPRQKTVEKLEALILSFGSDGAMFDTLTQLLGGSDYCFDSRIYTALRNYGRKIDRDADSLVFLHRQWQNARVETPVHFREYLTRLYYNTLTHDCFPMEIAPEAEVLCFQMLRQSGSPQAALTVAMAEQAANRPIYANAMLNQLAVMTNSLSDFPKSTLTALGMEDFPQRLQVAVPLPTLLDLFEQVLDQGSEGSILDFLNFCRNFISGDTQSLQELRNVPAGQSLTEQQSIQAISLLCGNPEEAEYWAICAHIPFEAGDSGRADFLHLCCRKNPRFLKEYVQLCETLSTVSQRLPAALAMWANVSGEDCRRDVENKLEKHPSYLEDLNDSENLCRLTQALCSQLNEQGAVMQHAQLRAVSLIAVSTGVPECLMILRRELGHLLFGSKNDLGVVVVSRLLLAGRFGEAREWLAGLNQSFALAKYRSLIDELAVYDADGLRQWVEAPSSRMLLELILPDGNQPNFPRVASMTASALLTGTEAEAVTVLKRISQIFPDDYVTAYELLELCKSRFTGDLSMLQSCLITLARVSDNADNIKLIRRYDDRTQDIHILSLAILNQLIIQNRQVAQISTGWDFSGSTVQGLANLGVIVRDPLQISSIEQQVRDSLANQPEDIRALRTKAWLASITGNWADYLYLSYQAGQTGTNVFFPRHAIEDLGFSRSILLLLSQAEDTLHQSLLLWLKEIPTLSPNKVLQLQVAQKLQESRTSYREFLGSGANLLLRFPLENGRLFESMSDQVLKPMLTGASAEVTAAFRFLCALGGKYAMYTVYNLAESYFSKEQDGIAHCLYSALHDSCFLSRFSHATSYRYSPTITLISSYHYKKEEYQMKMRICGVFSGDQKTLDKLASPTLSPWTTINLVLCMAASRTDEILRLESYMHPDSALVAEQVRMYLDRAVSDEAKYNTLSDIRISPYARYYLGLTLSYKYNDKLHFLQTEIMADKVSKCYKRLYNEIQNDYSIGKRNLLCQLVSCWTLTANINIQRDPASWVRTSVVKPVEEVVYRAPEYAAELTPLSGDEEDIRLLWEQYRQISAGSQGHFTDKARISGEIYRRTLGGDCSANDCYRALLRYSVDHFYDLISSGTQQSRGLAFRLLLQLMENEFGNISDGKEYDALVELVNAIGLAGLMKSHTNIRLLAKTYADNTAAFAKLRSLILDKMVFRDMGVIYEVLAKLNKEYLVFQSDRDTDKIIKALSQADGRIGAMDGSGAVDIRSHTQRIIRSELAALSRRAVLEIQLLNTGAQPRLGNLTGIILNKGTVKAESLTLQAFYGNLSSGQYTLQQLLPNEKAIFEIPYEAAPEETELRGHLDLVGLSGENNVSSQVEFALTLGTTSGSALPYNAYPTDRAQFTFNPETQNVESENFFGRGDETARMRALVSEKSFDRYHSAVVYGVRRTGKTSLLEYFREYVLGVHPECLCVRVDAQETDLTIHSVFVRCLLQTDLVVKTLEHCGDRDAFLEKWMTLPPDTPDMNPDQILVFFRELYQLTGKGMILIIDEIDRLFKSIHDNLTEQGLNKFLGCLSALLDNSDRRAYFQLVICGSNWLMHYASVGNNMQQVFQRFGDYKISVGHLPAEDVMSLLNSVPVNYAPGTRELIHEYTGGLIWFVKLLANAAIRRAKAANRDWVYPADVFFSLADVLTDQNCEQFYEGCTSGSMERRMIDAMQSLAYRKGMYLSLDTISELLDSNPQEIEQTLKKLILFEIVERNPVKQDLVRFRLDIYRRYFRTTRSAFPYKPEETVVFESPEESDTGDYSSTVGEIYDDDEEV